MPSGRLSGTYSGALTFSNVSNSFTGSGAGLTGLNAGNISTGTLTDARLSANVAMRNAANAFGAFTNTLGGNVGIGTTSPGALLDVFLAGVNKRLQIRADGGVVGMNLTGTGSLVGYMRRRGGRIRAGRMNPAPRSPAARVDDKLPP